MAEPRLYQIVLEENQKLMDKKQAHIESGHANPRLCYAQLLKGRFHNGCARLLARSEASRTLLQVVPRFDSVMSREYGRAARLLNRTAVTEK